MISVSEILNWYNQHFEDRLSGRYICLKHINPILFELEKNGLSKVAGVSEKGQNISLVKIGNGSKKVLAWSQMHGNESTTTKAIFDFLKFVLQKDLFKNEISAFKSEWTFYIIPILNPDGASLYTRENANGIDLNRDAQDLSQAESKILNTIFNQIKPDYCLNLHDQRTIYSLPGKLPATISFLAPAADAKRQITPNRERSMLKIVNISSLLQKFIPNQIGRYDDTFNINCVGDTFQKAGVPTILFEAGHYPNDYQREKTRELIFYALLSFFQLLGSESKTISVDDYHKIPENTQYFYDIVLRNVKLNDKIVDIAIQYQEQLIDNNIQFVPYITEIENEIKKIGHKELNLKGDELLINSHENVFVNDKISTISLKKTKKAIIL